MIITIDDYLDSATCDALIDLGRNHKRRDSMMAGNTITDLRFKKVSDILSEEGTALANMIDDLDQRITLTVNECFGVSATKTRGHFYEYNDGDFFRPHSDVHIVRHTPSVTWARSYTPRDVSVVMYLNEDFEGGELVFIHREVSVQPKKGLLVLFTSGWQNDHGVKPVKGIRYCIANWFATTPQLVAPVEQVPEPYASRYPLSERYEY